MEICCNGELVMPKSYAAMGEEEMTYVEGGAIYTVNLTAQQCADIAAYGAGATAMSQLLNLIPGGGNIAAAVVGAVTGTYSVYFWLGSNHNGMTLNIVTAGDIYMGMIPTINW